MVDSPPSGPLLCTRDCYTNALTFRVTFLEKRVRNQDCLLADGRQKVFHGYWVSVSSPRHGGIPPKTNANQNPTALAHGVPDVDQLLRSLAITLCTPEPL
jgi:hypothetical protein